MRTLYRITLKNAGDYFVVAMDPTSAAKAIVQIHSDEGFTTPVTNIAVICTEILIEDKPFHLNTGRNLLVVP